MVDKPQHKTWKGEAAYLRSRSTELKKLMALWDHDCSDIDVWNGLIKESNLLAERADQIETPRRAI